MKIIQGHCTALPLIDKPDAEIQAGFNYAEILAMAEILDRADYHRLGGIHPERQSRAVGHTLDHPVLGAPIGPTLGDYLRLGALRLLRDTAGSIRLPQARLEICRSRSGRAGIQQQYRSLSPSLEQALTRGTDQQAVRARQ